MPIYDKAHFIAKFEAIPEDRWCKGQIEDDSGRCCAIGHCHPVLGGLCSEGEALARLFPGERHNCGKLIVARINDGEDPQYQQPTPKQRVLAALRDL